MNNSIPGKIGIRIVTAPGGFTQREAAGLKQIATVTFQALATSLPNTPITFGSTPTVQLTKDAANNPLQTTYINGLVVFVQGLEGDLAPRNTGDGQLLPNDVTIERLFVVGSITPDPSFNEFQRADTAPSNTGGDGVIDATDLVKVRRYVAGLDNPTGASGPTGPAGPIAPPALTAGDKDDGRSLRLGSVSASAGSRVTVPVELDARGDEVAASFTLNYDPMKLRNPHVDLGAAAGGAVLTVNTDQPGRIAVLVDSNNPLAKQLMSVSFDVTETAASGETTVAFGSDPTPGSISNAVGESLAIRYTNGVITITGPNVAGVDVSGRVMTSDGRGLRNALVTITGLNGESRTVTTGAFGNYTFDGVAPGKTYRISVASRQFRFATRTLQVVEGLTDVDFVGLE